jgi:hypothetical protein
MWYNMGQGKQTENKGGKSGMTEKQTERKQTETGTETGEKKPVNKTETRNEKGQWVKGVCGNPSGRPNVPVKAKEMLISMLPKALNVLQEIIDDPKAKQETKIRAAELVIDRNLGKAVTPVLTESVGKDSSLTLTEMIACARELLESGEK